MDKSKKVFVCDHCHEQTTVEIRTPEGHCLCPKCAKAAKRQKHARKPIPVKTSDAFVKVARELDWMTDNANTRPFVSCIRFERGRRTFTNGCVLISERRKWGETFKSIDLVTLGPAKVPFGIRSASLTGIVTEAYDRPDDHVVSIPEDFYTYVKAFRGEGCDRMIKVRIADEKIRVGELDDNIIEMEYRGIPTNGTKVCFNLHYLMVLRPRALSIKDGSHAAVILGSYVKGLPTDTAVLMPVND